jgi:hypothetical protein
MAKFSRTELVGGKPVVTLFATGEACLNRQLDMLDELIVNNGSFPEIAEPVKAAKEALAVLGSRVEMPKHRVATGAA